MNLDILLNYLKEYWYVLLIIVLIILERVINKIIKKKYASNEIKQTKATKVTKHLFGIGRFAIVIVLFINILSPIIKMLPNNSGVYYPKIEKLQTPTNVNFNEDTYSLSWNEVDNAVSYVVDFNGYEYSTEEISYSFLISEETNKFKVKAIGDNIDYSDSDWSNELTYTLTIEQLSVYEKVNIQLAQTASENNLTLIKVIGISEADLEKTYGVNLSFETICGDENENVNATISYVFDNMDTIDEMLNSISSYTSSVVVERNIVDYNSAEELIYSNSFDANGNMEILRQQGYKFSVVDSCVRKGSKSGSSFNFSIVGTYKAEKDGDVKYFTSVNNIKIHQASRIEEFNYTISVTYAEDRTVTESYFVEHTDGPTWVYMEELVNKLENK